MPQIPIDRPHRHDEFMRLFVGHERRIYGYIRTLVPNRADAENLLQECAVVLWEKFAEFQPGSNFLSWALAIARFKVLDYRKQLHRDTLTFSSELIDALEPVSAEIAQCSIDMRVALEACMEKLRKADCDLFVRRHVASVSVPQLAEELRRPTTTLYSSLARIQRTLLERVQRQLRAEGRR